MGQVNISNIKTQIKSIIDDANTTTASPIDVSSGLTHRLKVVAKVNPDRIPMQADLFPFVSIFTEDKTPKQITMGHRSQRNAKRQADLTINVFAAVNESYVTDILESQADENIERLIENVEDVLREYPKLNGSVDWCEPTNVTYHTVPWDEETHVRAAIMSLNCRVYY